MSLARILSADPAATTGRVPGTASGRVGVVVLVAREEEGVQPRDAVPRIPLNHDATPPLPSRLINREWTLHSAPPLTPYLLSLLHSFSRSLPPRSVSPLLSLRAIDGHGETTGAGGWRRGRRRRRRRTRSGSRRRY